MLKVRELTAGYGDIVVLRQVSFDVRQGEILALVGSNAAGKTTVLQTITGLLKPISGEIYFADKRIDGLSPKEIVDSGFVLIPEGRRLFAEMTVKENLDLGAYTLRARKNIGRNKGKVYALFPRLKERANQLAGSLSGGEQQMCAIGRGLMAEPVLLALDEPSLGLAPILVEQVMHIVKEINKMGTTVLLVEQNVNLSMKLANHICVMENGSIVFQGIAEELSNNDKLRKAYLGM
jgi:branched-chain amino acid transport system ATP-binding protein